MTIHVTPLQGRVMRELLHAPTRLPPGAGQVDRLYLALQRPDLPPRTRELLAAPLSRKARKLIEEATEVALDALRGNRKGVVRESADLIYHLTIIWRDAGIDPHEIWTEMARRSWQLGIAEKLPKDASKGVSKGASKSIPKTAAKSVSRKLSRKCLTTDAAYCPTDLMRAATDAAQPAVDRDARDAAGDRSIAQPPRNQ